MIFIQKFAITCRVGLWNKQMPYFSSVSDEWSRDLKSVQVQKQLSCRDESPDPSMSKIVLRNLIISSKYYNEEEAKELLEVITAERLLTVKVPNKSDGWEYFSSLEKAFAGEMVSDELKPKVLLCMLGDKVSNLLVNLGEEELKDYESLKQVVLKEYEPSPKYV
ncbi:hypothetical protein TNCV_3328021 [Trichonephila clavipes]|nr:hypothetical protein TNCV_3328021 [Trichonephila clavipes]